MLPSDFLIRYRSHQNSSPETQSIGQPDDRISFLALRPGHDTKNFFFFSGYFDYARHISAEWSVYAMDCPHEVLVGKDGIDAVLLADRCIAAMKAIQEKGPYRIGGYCFGALIAHSTAARLQIRGEQVTSLILVEPPSPPGILPKSSDFIFRYLHFVRNMLAHGRRSLSATLRNRWQRYFHLYKPDKKPRIVNLSAYFSTNIFLGVIVVILANNTYHRLSPRRDPRLAWHRLASKGIQIIEMSGDHVTCCRSPHVVVLASIINRILRRY